MPNPIILVESYKNVAPLVFHDQVLAVEEL